MSERLRHPRRMDADLAELFGHLLAITAGYPDAYEHGLTGDQLVHADEKGSIGAGQSDPTGSIVASESKGKVRSSVRLAGKEIDLALDAMRAASAAVKKAMREPERVDWWEEARRMSRDLDYPQVMADEELASIVERARARGRDVKLGGEGKRR